jgi:uncharacterized peroxidase-related enzyme
MISWIDVIDEDRAEGELKKIYDEVSRSRGKVANVYKVHSLNPAAMQAHLDLYMTIMFGRSDLLRADRELIAVVVSSANRCPYCVEHHAAALNRYWKDDEKVARAISDFRSLDLTKKQLAMCNYAEKLTRFPGDSEKDDVQALRDARWPDPEILQISLIASYFNFVNRITLGLGVQATPEEAEGYEV